MTTNDRLAEILRKIADIEKRQSKALDACHSTATAAAATGRIRTSAGSSCSFSALSNALGNFGRHGQAVHVHGSSPRHTTGPN